MNHFRQRLCFSAPTISDILLDSERKNEFQDLLVFFGTDNNGNMVMLCVNQIYSFKQSNSFVYIRDHTGLELTNKEVDNGSYEFSNWKTSSLQFHCIVPMQTWRIVFSGCLRNRDDHHHVKINFLWKPFGFPVYYDKNNTFFKHEIDPVDTDIITKNLLGFDQFGQISGTVIVDGKTETINMSGIKIRRWNMSMNDSVFASFTTGCSEICCVQKLEWINCCGHLKTNSEHEMLKSNEICFSEENDKQTITIKHKNFNLKTSLNVRTPMILNSVSIENIFEDGLTGIQLYFRDTPKHDIKIKFEQISVNSYVGLAVNLDSDICTQNNIVGNKAKSLFRLKKAIANGLIKDAVVPDGICITTVAMRTHINENEDLSNSLNDAIRITKENDFQRLLDYCERLENKWMSSKPSAELLKAISNGVHERSVYAVRSSGTFEDGELTSSAGQYVTKLGCTGLPDIVAALLECWSSNFSARALSYRKNNGQPLICEMAVVIQDQVYGQVAGVAFTRDPNTGDPQKITIAASPGPGEGIVSGSVEPDAVVIHRQFYDDSVLMPSITSNFKVERNVVGGAAKPCASDDLLKKLADLCIQTENVFGSPQDIEWAAIDDRVYLLQSRPITSIFAWSDDEITHEFDTPFTADDVVMFYNVKEVYPNPVHPLSLTLDFFSSYPLFKLTNRELTDIYRNKQLFYTHYNMGLNVCQMFQDVEPESIFVKIIEYSIAGKSFLTDGIWEKILSKNRSSALKRFYKSISTFKETLYLEPRLTETHQLICNVNVESADSASDLLNEIDIAMEILEKATFCHAATSTNNVVSHTMLVILGLGFNKDSTTESLLDLAAMIKTPDIINVSILKDIKAIADIISEMPSKTEFCNVPIENCYDWLKINSEKGYSQVEDFITKYGHRGIQELDFGSETWATDPGRLFSCLRSLILSDHYQPPAAVERTDDQSNTSSRGYIKKMVFNYLLNKYRQSISYREQSKDMLVQITHNLRLAYRKLGEILLDQGRIPDSKLIFFMSQYEMRKICENNCPVTVHKASKRRKLWPTLCSLQFNDVYCGSPVPTNSLIEESIDSSTQLNGCCVFPGWVKNRACVLERIEDAHYLQTGDILIVKSVDIAWSPYFTIISGLVTEIGGIISHGAVVAREYGLPCLVGVQNVKKHFKTGDVVILDSKKGFIIKSDTTELN